MGGLLLLQQILSSSLFAFKWLHVTYARFNRTFLRCQINHDAGSFEIVGKYSLFLILGGGTSEPGSLAPSERRDRL